MSEKKKKGKVYPFTEYLHQDEHILWVDEASVSRFPSMITFYYCGALISLGLWVVTLNQSHEIYYTFITSGICALFIFIMGLVIKLTDVKVSPRDSYALTNKHVFSWVGNQVVKVSLKDIRAIEIARGVSSKGTLTFGDEFLTMPNIDDAAYVKTMIEQAQKHRLEEIDS
jgi:hypothetical protein